MAEGTDLGGCVKTGIPCPDGRWGVVLAVDDDGRAWLQILAFGERHPREPWRARV